MSDLLHGDTALITGAASGTAPLSGSMISGEMIPQMVGPSLV